MTGALSGAPDSDQIMIVFQKYIDGAKSGRSSDMKPAFHEDATIFGYVGKSVWGGPIQRFFDAKARRGRFPLMTSSVRISISTSNSAYSA